MWSSDNLEMIDEPKFPEYKFSFLTIWPGQLGFNKDNKVILLLNELFNSEILSLSNSDGLDWSKDMSWSQSGAMETPQHGNVSTRKCLKKSRNPSKTVFLEAFPQFLEGKWRNFPIFLRDYPIFLRCFCKIFEAFPYF